jgi:osmotically-inducible protein OsmY
MDRDQMRDRQYQGDRFEDESSYRGGGERTMTSSQDRQRQGGQSGMERSGSTSSGMTTSGEAGGDWQGFVVPYRYYGPGYAGLGYYAVYYQGGAGHREEGDTSQDFEERSDRYGQGQGAGAAWQSGRSQGGGQWQRSGGQSGTQRGQWQNQGGQWGQAGQSGGGYAGRGPKGYRRSDDRIREEISDQFMENDQLDASEIEVQVSDGVVTLTGTVDDRQAKRLAEDMAERASGVRDVMNHLKVDNESSMRASGGSSTRGDGRDQAGTTGTGSSGSRTSGSRSSGSSTGSRSRSGTSSGTGSRSSSRTTAGSQSSRSGTGQPVGAGTGGATDGATGNGSNRDQSNRESEGGSR